MTYQALARYANRARLRAFLMPSRFWRRRRPGRAPGTAYQPAPRRDNAQAVLVFPYFWGRFNSDRAVLEREAISKPPPYAMALFSFLCYTFKSSPERIPDVPGHSRAFLAIYFCILRSHFTPAYCSDHLAIVSVLSHQRTTA